MRAPGLASRLRKLIAGRHHLRDLASASGLDKGTISAWTKDREDGKVAAVRVEAVAKLAKVLGVEVAWLLGLPTSEQDPGAALVADLLGRVSLISHHAERLELSAEELDRELTERLGHVSELSLLLAELRELEAEARRIPPESLERSSEDPG